MCHVCGRGARSLPARMTFLGLVQSLRMATCGVLPPNSGECCPPAPCVCASLLLAVACHGERLSQLAARREVPRCAVLHTN